MRTIQTVPKVTRVNVSGIPTETIDRLRPLAVANGFPATDTGVVRFAVVELARSVAVNGSPAAGAGQV